MAILGKLGGLLAGLGATRNFERDTYQIGGQEFSALQLQQMAKPQLQALQQQMANQFNTYAYTTDSTACDTNVYQITAGSLAAADFGSLYAPTARKESAVEWLDRRVEEMRVKL